MGTCSSQESLDVRIAATDCEKQFLENMKHSRQFSEDSDSFVNRQELLAEVNSLVNSCKLVPYGRSGYIRETYRSGMVQPLRQETRSELTETEDNLSTVSAYINLIVPNSVCFWRTSECDQVHFYHGGSGMFIDLIDPQGIVYKDIRLGIRTTASSHMEFIPQVIVPAGWYKLYRFTQRDTYCLFGATVTSQHEDGIHPSESFVSSHDLQSRLRNCDSEQLAEFQSYCSDFAPGSALQMQKLKSVDSDFASASISPEKNTRDNMTPGTSASKYEETLIHE